MITTSVMITTTMITLAVPFHGNDCNIVAVVMMSFVTCPFLDHFLFVPMTLTVLSMACLQLFLLFNKEVIPSSEGMITTWLVMPSDNLGAPSLIGCRNVPMI